MLRTGWTDERGSALPLLAIVLGGVALALSLILVQTQHRVRVAQAQWAADGSAAAAAAEVVAGFGDGGPAATSAAAEVAEANGARLIAVRVVAPGRVRTRSGSSSQAGIEESVPISPTVLVEVELGGVRAQAAAARFAVARP